MIWIPMSIQTLTTQFLLYSLPKKSLLQIYIGSVLGTSLYYPKSSQPDIDIPAELSEHLTITIKFVNSYYAFYFIYCTQELRVAQELEVTTVVTDI